MFNIRTLIVLLFPFVSLGQNQERGLFLYNAGFGGITAAIGSVLNKTKGEDWKRCMIRGFWQGSIGGSVSFFGKKTTYLIKKHNSALYGLPGFLLNDAGNSIVEGAALNKTFLRTWHIYYGLTRIDWSIGSSSAIKLRLTPASLAAFIGELRYGHIDLETSLYAGAIVFRREHTLSNNILGFTRGRVFVYVNDNEKFHTIAHELNHVFQYNQYQICNTWVTPIVSKTGSVWKNLFSKYIYLDIPYFPIAYAVEGAHPWNTYFRNYFEFEAEHFATNSYVPR